MRATSRKPPTRSTDRQRDVRDKFLVERGLWGEFVKWLPDELPPVAAEARLAECENENYELRLIIMGGEDAPGFAGSVPLNTLRDQMQRERLDMSQSLEASAARLAECERERDEARNAGIAIGQSQGFKLHLKLQDRVEALEKALGRIAAFDDSVANAKLAATGSYYYFDEPRAVKIARAALKAEAPNE
jgi:hypothetical protein